MRQSEKHKKAVQLFFKGTNRDINPEISGLTEGFYRDANNMRLTEVGGNASALERIKGETILHSDPLLDFTCIGAVEVNYHTVEIWVRDDDSEVRFRIDGGVMVHDTANLMGLSVSKPLQMDKSDDCKGGEFYFVDFVTPPYIFSVQDIIDNFGVTQKYFADFNPLLYQVLLEQSLNIPVFDELVDIGGTGGLFDGQYAYSIAYVDATGNVTKYSPPTPLIPVMGNYESTSGDYPYSKTYGSFFTTIRSRYGIKIKFRVNNELNYSYVRVRRICWNTGQAIGYTPTAEYYEMPAELLPSEIGIKEFTDSETIDWLPLLDKESTAQLGAIEAAKAIRYFNGHLVLGNIRYHSRDLENKITFKKINNKTAFPFIDNLETDGYANPYHTAYKKSYMRGEKYGYGIACYDALGNISLVLSYEDMDSYTYPNRRTACSAETIEYSDTKWKGLPLATDEDNNDGEMVHECFQKRAFKKTTTDTRSIHTDNYNPYTPQFYDDTYEGHNTKINDLVAETYSPQLNIWGAQHTYNPSFGVDYYAAGLMFAGIEQLPDWVAGFSIVRTKPAGRVVAQGISTYYMEDDPQTKANVIATNTYNRIDKDLFSVAFYSDDINAGYASINNQYDYQAVSPLGYFSEVTANHLDYTGVAPVDFMYNKNCDMVVYARELYTDPSTQESPQLYRAGSIQSYWTRFGQWRGGAGGLFTGDTLFGITNSSIETFKSVGRSDYYKLELDNNIYTQISPQIIIADASTVDVNNATTQEWHEPFYIGNIVNDGAELPQNNIESYILTGHYQKVKSIIGTGIGVGQTIELIDERWEDCIPNQYSPDILTDNLFAYVDDGSDETAWLNITYKNAVDLATIIADINANGFYVADMGGGQTKDVYGVYFSGFMTGEINNEKAYIYFQEVAGLDSQYTIPQVDAKIIVRYDNRFPIRVYGGDTIVGESMFSPVDGKTLANGEVDSQNQLYSWVGFPYPAYDINQDVIDNANPLIGDGLQNQTFVGVNIIRQMLVMATVESRVHLPYSRPHKSSGGDVCDSGDYVDTNSFPRVHYILRPNKWDTDCVKNFDDDGGKIDVDYKTDYPGEFHVWNYGGFRFNQLTNRDYSQSNYYDRAFSKPIVGFEEQTSFCSRVISSVKRNINQQNDPNLKTFLALNAFDISDNMQEIKYLYDNDSEKGNNLFAITGGGVCLLVTDKRIVSELTGNELIALPADKLVTQEYWLRKDAGCNDEFWRGIAENNNTLFFPNSESVWMLNGMQVVDIGRYNAGSYYSRLFPVLQAVGEGYTTKMTGVYNEKDNEYWMHINNNINYNVYGGEIVYMSSIGIGVGQVLTVNSSLDIDVILPPIMPPIILPEQYYYIVVNAPSAKLRRSPADPVFAVIPNGSVIKVTRMSQTTWGIDYVSGIEQIGNITGTTFVYKNSGEQSVWVGTNDYFADKFLTVHGGNGVKDLTVHEMRDYQTYRTGIGDNINGAPVSGIVEYVIAKDNYVTKEFIDQTVNSTLEPNYMRYWSRLGGLLEAEQTNFRNYTYAYYTQIPRKTVSRDRFQGQYLVCEASFANVGDLVLTSIEDGYKIIR